MMMKLITMRNETTIRVDDVERLTNERKSRTRRCRGKSISREKKSSIRDDENVWIVRRFSIEKCVYFASILARRELMVHFRFHSFASRFLHSFIIFCLLFTESHKSQLLVICSCCPCFCSLVGGLIDVQKRVWGRNYRHEIVTFMWFIIDNDCLCICSCWTSTLAGSIKSTTRIEKSKIFSSSTLSYAF